MKSKYVRSVRLWGRRIGSGALLGDTKLYAWLCWLLASSFIFYKYLLQVSPSVMVSELMHDFDLTGQGLGSLAACYFYAYLAMQFPVGLLLDRYNPRYLISTAMLVCASGAFLFSQAVHLPLAQLGRVLIGIGGAFSAVGTMKIISVWFEPKKFALMSGLMMTMAMLGAIGGEAPLSHLVQALGWRHAIQLCAIAGVLLATFFFAFIRDKNSSTRLQAPRTFTMKTFRTGVLKLLKNPQSWFISIYSGLAFAPVSAFAGLWGVPFILQKYGMERSLAASLVSIAFVGFAMGAPFAGWLSDRIERRKPVMIMGTLMSFVTFSTIIYASALPFWVLAMLFLMFGLFSGCFFVSFATMREMHSHALSGTSIGFINMSNALLGAVCEPLIGHLLDLGWQHQMHNGVRVFTAHNYQQALIVLPIALGVALLCQLFVRETHCRG